MLDALRTFGARLSAFASSSRLDRDFDQELDAHVALLTEENIARGMTPDEARRLALVRTGNRASLKARHREARGLPALESIAAGSGLCRAADGKNAGFSAAAIVTIALGIGVNAMGFSIIHAAFLRGMPFEDGKALHMVTWTTDANRRSNTSFPEFELWRDRCPLVLRAGRVRHLVDESQRRSRAAGASRRCLGHGQCVRRPRATAAARPRAGGRGRAQRGRSRRRHWRIGLEKSLRERSSGRRQAGPAQRTSGDDRRRHAREDAVSDHGQPVGAVCADRGDGAARHAHSQRLRPSRSRDRSPNRSGRARRTGEAGPALRSRGDQGPGRRARRDVQRLLRRREGPADVPGRDGRRVLRVADRLRQRGQSDAVASGHPRPRDGGSGLDGRDAGRGSSASC